MSRSEFVSLMDQACELLYKLSSTGHEEELKLLRQGISEYESSGQAQRLKNTVLALESFTVYVKDNVANFKIRDHGVKEVGASCLDALSLIMSFYKRVSLEDCFKWCGQLNTLDFPSKFNTSNVTSMNSMFGECESLTSLDLSIFDTSNVTDMNCMFRGCSNLSSLDLSTFITSSVTDMSYMFYGCRSLSSLNLSTFNTNSVTDMIGMFYECRALKSLDLSTFDTSSVRDMLGMFSACYKLSSLDLSTFNTSSFTDMSGMFKECYWLKEVYVKDERIRSKLPSWVSVKTE